MECVALGRERHVGADARADLGNLQVTCKVPAISIQILAMDVLCYILSVLRRIEGDAAMLEGA